MHFTTFKGRGPLKVAFRQWKEMKKRQEIDARTWKLVRRIAHNIRKIREKRGLTQEDMENYGFGVRWYQRFESGRHIPTIPTLDKLARAFKVEIVRFFE